jgi:hypothetical protein
MSAELSRSNEVDRFGGNADAEVGGSDFSED